MDSNFTDTLQQDPIYDLTESSPGLLSTLTSANEQFDAPIAFDVPINDGASLGFYKDTDSLSTFRSTVRSVLKKKGRSPIRNTPTIASTPTHSVSFAPIVSARPDDTSVSRMSDTASKVADLESRFVHMETQFCSSFARLEAMLSGLKPNSLAAASSCPDRLNTPVNSSANHPSPVTAGGSTTHRATGPGS
jgi:hypothetical protein